MTRKQIKSYITFALVLGLVVGVFTVFFEKTVNYLLIFEDGKKFQDYQNVYVLGGEETILREDRAVVHLSLIHILARGEYDIMVGTQMVAKGLNFPRVTLVGVLSADQSLYSDDFRSFEKTFSLLTQVVGRCGRGELPGRAFVQTFSPENRIIELASTQNYEEYYAEEIAYRKLGLYPPYCELGAVGFVSPREDLCREAAKRFAGEFSRLAGTEYKDLPIRALGPTESAVFKVAGKYRCRYLIKYRSSARFRELMACLLYTSRCV